MKPNYSVLLVDDDPSLRIAMSDVLKFLFPHWQIWEAANGQEAVSLASRLLPDVILFDLHMPIMNGYEMAIILHSQPETRAIPLILATSEEMSNPLVMRLQTICHAVLPKPFSIEKLERSLKSVSLHKMPPPHFRFFSSTHNLPSMLNSWDGFTVQNIL
jgi:CheY-like chemotaxis protein